MSQTVLEEIGVAIVGAAGRFPGAPTLDALWSVVRGRRDVVTRFAVEDLVADEPDPTVLSQASYVRARGVLDGAEMFDADFFEYSPGDAMHLDPQHRVWLEVAWEALEAAGYAHDKHSQIVSVFAGSYRNTYLMHSLLTDRKAIEEYVRAQRPSALSLMVQNDPAHLPTRTAHRLNLRGPAINVQTACSTSLVAVALAVQNLLARESDVAIAGGVSIAFPQKTGYFYQEGAIMSRDGVCRPYDKDACGTVLGHGAGAVVLKRYADAVRDRDPILAVIRGAAINNDGRCKVSYFAPSVDGQASAIATALCLADVSADSVGYVEGHGTATPMGDPIEVEALTRAYRADTARRQYCCLGSVKGNIGHLDAAAGVAGLLRAVLALVHRELPPTAHFEEPNPELRLSESPFFVLKEARPWPSGVEPRRAAVSSFGLGGTNAHVILEEAPLRPSQPTDVRQESNFVLRLSARHPAALDAATTQLAEWLERGIERDLAPFPIGAVGSVLRDRRQEFECRRTVRVRSWADAIVALRDPQRAVTGSALPTGAQTVFLIPGQGSLRSGLVSRLTAADAEFRARLEEHARPASDLLHFDLWGWFCDEHADESALHCDNARYQLAIFCLNVAFARWLEMHSVSPAALLGHSLGELVALNLAGVLSAEHSLRAVFERGTLMQATGPGAALIVFLSEAEMLPLLDAEVTLACVNSPNLVLISGPPDAIARLENRLTEQKVSWRRAQINVAVHSPAMDQVIEPLHECLRALDWRAPSCRILSPVTGTWLDTATATNPAFWAQQVRAQVRFNDAAQVLANAGSCLALEVGLGSALSSLASTHMSDPRRQRALALLEASSGHDTAPDSLDRALQRLWTSGIAVDFKDQGGMECQSLPSLPTYQFQRRRFYVDPPKFTDSAGDPRRSAGANVAAQSGDALRRSDCTAGGGAGETVTGSEAMQDCVSRLVMMFERNLGIRGVGPGDNFFDRGGNSMLAVVLLGEVERAFGRPVPLSRFFEDPTPKGVEAALGLGGNPRAQSACHTFRAGGSRVPLFFICGIAIYRELAERLSAEHPAYAFYVQSEVELLRSRAQVTGEGSSFESLTKEYFERVVLVRPHGPYAFVGVSFGGLLALRLAEMFRARGEVVDLVALLDSLPPTLMRTSYLQRARLIGRKVMREGPGYLIPKALRVVEKRVGTRLPFRDTPVTSQENAANAAYELERTRECAYAALGATYRPKEYAGRVALFLSLERERTTVTTDLVETYWRSFVRGEFVSARVTGGHVGMLAPPYVDELAPLLQQALDRQPRCS